jgi:hypothetical protein
MNLLLILPFLGTLLSKLLRAFESEPAPSHRMASRAGRTQRASRLRLSRRDSIGEKLAALFSRCGSKRAGLISRTAQEPRAAALGQTPVGWGQAFWLAAAASLGWTVRLAEAAWRLAESQPPRCRTRWLRCGTQWFCCGTQWFCCSSRPWSGCAAQLLGPVAGQLVGPRLQPCLVPMHRCTEARAIVHDRCGMAARIGPGPRHPIDWA